jgi:hypothetical protein
MVQEAMLIKEMDPKVGKSIKRINLLQYQQQNVVVMTHCRTLKNMIENVK